MSGQRMSQSLAITTVRDRRYSLHVGECQAAQTLFVIPSAAEESLAIFRSL